MKYFISFMIAVFAFAKAYTQEIAPQTATVDIQSIRAVLTPQFETKSIKGQIWVSFQPFENVSEVRLDAKKMTVTDSSDIAEVLAEKDHILFKGNFKASKKYTVQFEYTATPKQTMYFVNTNEKDQVWTQGQGKYTSHWLPSIDDVNDKIEFDISVIAPSAYQVITNGKMIKKETLGSNIVWSFDMKKPMSSYLVALAIGDYQKTSFPSTSGIPLEFYYYPEDALLAESTYRYSKKIFDFFEKKIGVPYPWQNYKQVPVKDFLYAGMENTGTTIFSDSFVVDSIGFTDRNYVNVNAHELAHQWFGDLVTATKSEHHWLQEGFATYYALLAEREVFGDDYFYYKLYESAEQLRELSDQGKGQKLVAAGGSSLTYYQKGAWALHILKETVGEYAFAKAVKKYLETYQYKNVTTDDFMNEVEAAYGQELTEYKKGWLYQSAFQAAEALESLKKSSFMRSYFELQALRPVALKDKIRQLDNILKLPNDYLGQEAVYQLAGTNLQQSIGLYKQAFTSKNTLIRQAIATSVEQIPQPLVYQFESFLRDDSYVTREQAFLKLWLLYRATTNFKKQKEVLNQMDGQFGFSDGNIRTLWLTLSLATQGYKSDEAGARYDELVSYTGEEHPFQLRENAFQFLTQIQSFDRTSLKNLVEACTHHNWRFRESSRALLNQLSKEDRIKDIMESVRPLLSKKELAYLERVNL
ncbi:M1 family metallopeptidase [uncultured Dokdonia sp.]|uniref:M1 family metallopeptidase n=1 Tax=uncultured Dokdonia sp. TaxID=575653 RepID=UPI002610A059|nr:M1 family metallopeptidase [uncultured Dokdonia sp.]